MECHGNINEITQRFPSLNSCQKQDMCFSYRCQIELLYLPLFLSAAIFFLLFFCLKRQSKKGRVLLTYRIQVNNCYSVAQSLFFSLHQQNCCTAKICLGQKGITVPNHNHLISPIRDEHVLSIIVISGDCSLIKEGPILTKQNTSASAQCPLYSFFSVVHCILWLLKVEHVVLFSSQAQ